MKTTDIIRLNFYHDLTEGGIAYTTRALARSILPREDSIYGHLRQSVAGTAVELAFRRHLSDHKIPFGVKTPAAFTDPDRYDVMLGSHRCIINSFFISTRKQIMDIHRDLEILVSAPALVPLDEDAGEEHRDADIYLFAFATGLTAASQSSQAKAIAAGQPIHLMHALPRSWATPKSWISLGQVALKSEADFPLSLDLCGQTEEREIINERLILPPQARIESTSRFFSISSIHVDKLPNGRVGIHASRQKEVYIIQPHTWNNLWVYGMDIYLVGWISHAEYRKHAALIQPGTRVFQFNRTRLKNLALPVQELHPITDLLDKEEAWKPNKQSQQKA
jgi:hypothetical protein